MVISHVFSEYKEVDHRENWSEEGFRRTLMFCRGLIDETIILECKQNSEPTTSATYHCSDW